LTLEARGNGGNMQTYRLAGLAECFELREALFDVAEISLLPEKLLGGIQ